MYIGNQVKNTARHRISLAHTSFEDVSAQNHSESVKKNNFNDTLKAALVQFSKNEFLNRDQALQLYDYFSCVIPDLKCNELTYGDYFQLVSNNYISLNNIPIEYLTEEMCLKACQFYWANMHHVPEHLRNKKMWVTACMQSPHALEIMPKHYITKELINSLPSLSEMSLKFIPDAIRDDSIYTKACEYSTFAMSLIPKNHPQYDKFLAITTTHHGVYLEHFNKEKITPELCLQACSRHGAQLQHVPPHLKTFQLCKIAVQSHFFALRYLPSHLTNQEKKELYRLACSRKFYALRLIPEEYITEELCILAAKSNSMINFNCLPPNLSQITLNKIYEIAFQNDQLGVIDFPKSLITKELCYSCAGNEQFRLNEVPEKFLDDEIWNKSKVHSFKIYNNFTYKLFQKYRHLIKFIPKIVQLNLLSEPLPIDEKLDFINFIDTQHYEANSILNSDMLVKKQSPLLGLVNNPYIYYLVENAYSTTPLPLRLQDLGKRLHNYISNTALIFPQSLNIEELLSTYSHEMAGGRTLAFSISENQSLYLKFKKTNESIEELNKEGNVYRFINNDAYLKRRLKSKLPTSMSLEKIPVTDALLKIIKQSDDEIETIKENNNSYVYALSFNASPDYSRYAHLVDHTNSPKALFHKPELGMKTACHDAGVLASMGIILPSLLPAFHDSTSNRRWVALHSAFNNRSPCHPGTFGAWNTTATERPDLGYGGIRDLGDYEIYGEIKTCLQQEDTKEASTLHPNEVLQRLGFCNAICETLLSAVLVRSRLQQQNPSYHYKNSTCLNETKHFIEEISNQFLSGFFEKDSSEPLLQKLLHLDDEKYIKWLERSALEIIYWTSPQAGVDLVNGEMSQSPDCYLKHMIQDGVPSTTLYPHSVKKHKYDFFNKAGKLNLGANNTTFPFVSFMNGLTLLCTNLFEDTHYRNVTKSKML